LAHTHVGGGGASPKDASFFISYPNVNFPIVETPRNIEKIHELKSGGFRRDSILADAVEGIIGAIYLDAGMDVCRQHILEWYKERLNATSLKVVTKDAKTRLQEFLQARKHPLPQYEVVDIVGEPHAQTFFVHCQIELFDAPIEGKGSSRRIAEQNAAAKANEGNNTACAGITVKAKEVAKADLHGVRRELAKQNQRADQQQLEIARAAAENKHLRVVTANLQARDKRVAQLAATSKKLQAKYSLKVAEYETFVTKAAQELAAKDKKISELSAPVK